MTLPVIHTSDRLAFKQCRQKWQFASPLQMDLEPDRPVMPLWFGIGIHRALGAYYDPCTPRHPGLGLETFRQFCHDEVLKYEDREGILWQETRQQFEEHEALGIAMLEHYFDWCEKEDGRDGGFEVIWVEREFFIRIPGVEAIYSFRVDGLLRDAHGRFWVLDHKTSVQIPDRFDWLDKDEQVGSYLWALQILLGIQIEGFYYNMLRKKAPRPLTLLKSGHLSANKQQDTTFSHAKRQLQEFYPDGIPRYYKDLLDHLRAKGNRFFHRQIVRRNQKELANLGRVIAAEAKDMITPTVEITRNPTRWNCSGCPFVAPCTSKWEDSDWRFILDHAFRPKEHLE
jgi:hypothetical protein